MQVSHKIQEHVFLNIDKGRKNKAVKVALDFFLLPATDKTLYDPVRRIYNMSILKTKFQIKINKSFW